MGGGEFMDLTHLDDQKADVDADYGQFLLGNGSTICFDTKEIVQNNLVKPNEISLQHVEESRASGLGIKRWKMSDDTFNKHLENIWGSISDDKKKSFAYVDSLCFWLYQRKGIEALKMAKEKDIFSKKYVFVPIVGWDHWRLLVFCHFGEKANSKTRTRCILLLDSIALGASVIEPEVRKFVFDIFEAECRSESKDVIHRIPLFVPKVPQQTNGVDCGRFVLYFIKMFVADAPENFSISNYPYPYFLQPNWFGPETFGDFCDELEEEIPTYQPEVSSSRRRSQRVRKKRTSSQISSSHKIEKLNWFWPGNYDYHCEDSEEEPTRAQSLKEDWLNDLSYVYYVESEYPTVSQGVCSSTASSRSSTTRNVLQDSSSESVEVILVNE